MDVHSKHQSSPGDDAAQWFARLHAPDCTGRDRAEFEAWLRADTRHWRAYAEAERVARRFDQLIEADEALSAMAADALHAGAEPAPRPRWRLPAAIAASVVVTMFALRLADPFEQPATAEQRYANTTDRQYVVTLADDSVVHLDVGSELVVDLAGRERRLSLERGRALFEVAHDSARPFVVTAGGTRTTALGTVFQVERDAERVVVVLTEGSVAVTPAKDRYAWREMLVPGEQISLANERAAPVRHTVDGTVKTSWSRGRLVFRGTPLAEAIEEINRYSGRKLRLADASLADLHVGGTFFAGDSALVASAFAAALPIRTVDGAGGEILLFRRYDIGP
jgi:transmembrane sensor